MEYQRTADHQNADALSSLRLGKDELFDKEESEEMLTLFVQFQVLLFQMEASDPAALQKDTAKDVVIPHSITSQEEVDRKRTTATVLLRNIKNLEIL